MPQLLTSAIARPRAAASLVLLHRRETGEPEFLLGRRPATMAFMPDAYVFPGAAVSPWTLCPRSPRPLASVLTAIELTPAPGVLPTLSVPS